jgi:hypothetical protein
MLKRPHLTNKEEQEQYWSNYADETTSNLRQYKEHMGQPNDNGINIQNHTSRHHRKHEKNVSGFETSTSLSSITFSSTHFINSQKKILGHGGNQTTKSAAHLTSKMDRSIILATPRPKKNGRRHKIQGSANNSYFPLDADDEKYPQRRKKNHSRRKNNTVLTNNVHEDIPTPDTQSTEATIETTPSKKSFITGKVRSDKFLNTIFHSNYGFIRELM